MQPSHQHYVKTLAAIFIVYILTIDINIKIIKKDEIA